MYRTYVIVAIDTATEEASERDVSTWIRVPLTVYACILREAVGVQAVVRGESRRGVVRASRDTQPPPSLSQNPPLSHYY